MNVLADSKGSFFQPELLNENVLLIRSASARRF